MIFLPKRRLVLLWATLATSSSQAIGTFRLDYEYEIEYSSTIFEFETSDVSRALALHVAFR